MATQPVVIIGAGLAGASCALALAPIPVLLISAAPIGHDSSSAWAQGGIAAAVGPDDTVACHAADTHSAGDGLCDPASVTRFTNAGPALIAALTKAGVQFDHDHAGRLALGLEAAHSRRRIVHAADGTGREIMRVLAAQIAATPSIVCRRSVVQRLVAPDGVIAGIVLADGTTIAASRVVLATGGLGGLYPHTTNPRSAWGQGLMLAGGAGALLTDLEFVQFHPTALDCGRDPMPLISEALRGEGATLIDEHGTRFMAGMGRAELEPRDVVARAVTSHIRQGHQVLLDATHLGPGFASHFPGIAAACQDAGFNPQHAPIPVRPAAHYHMGGIKTDAAGRTSIAGLFACGECAGTGLHGANRLASNSLLEAAVAGAEVAATILSCPVPHALPLPDQQPGPQADPTLVRPIMAAGFGVLRDEAGMTRAIDRLCKLVRQGGPPAGPAMVGLAVGLSALLRRESRGAHCRTDTPATAPDARRSEITFAGALHAAQDCICVDA